MIKLVLALPENVFISLSLLSDSVTTYIILDWQWFSLSFLIYYFIFFLDILLLLRRSKLSPAVEFRCGFTYFFGIWKFIIVTIKTYDLGLSFLSSYKAKRETLAPLRTLKQTPGTSQTAWLLQSGNQNFTIFLNKTQTTTIGYKGYGVFCPSWSAVPRHTSWWQNLAVWLQPLLSPAQFPLHGKHL